MRNKKSVYVPAVLLLLAVVVTYSNHFYNSFHFDDSHAVVNNIYIKSLRNIPLFFKDATTFSSLPANQTYRPVVLTSLAFDYYLGKGLNPFYFHLSMFVLFIVQGLFMYMLYLKVFYLSEKHIWNSITALCAVAWYLLHPANAETINYISARSDTLSTLFGLISMVLFIYSAFCRKWLIYLIPLTIAVLAKPIAVFFVLLLMVYIYLFEDASAESLTRKKKETPSHAGSVIKKTWPALLCALSLMIFTKVMTPPAFSSGGAPFFNYVITQPYVVLHYFTTFFLPVSLSADTDWGPLSSLAPRFFIGTAFLAVLLYASFYAVKSRKTRPIAFGLLWFFIALIPTSLFPLAEVMNDHRIFFPYIGLTISTCWALALGTRRLREATTLSGPLFTGALSVIIIAGLCTYAFGTYQRNRVWKTEETLWNDVTEKSPANGRGLMNYGLVLMGRGDYSGAEKYFNKALEFTPKYSYLHINLGILKAAMGRLAEAEEYFKKASELNSRYPGSYFFYARFLKKQGRIDEAIVMLQKALELSPAAPDSRYLLMEIYYDRSDFVKLSELANQTLQIAPGDQKSVFYLDAVKNGKARLEIPKETAGKSRTPEDFLDLSMQYYRVKQFDKSIEAANKALKLKPDYDLAYNNICAVYNELKQWDKAIEAGEKAVKLNPNNQLAKNNLAWARSQKALSEKSGKRDRR